MGISHFLFFILSTRYLSLHLFTMKTIFFACLLAIATADLDSSDSVEILQQDFITPDVSGGYSLVLETSDGTQIQDAGAGTGPDGAVETQGSVRFIHPNGEEFVLKYVANAEGAYQPESSALPVAPAFPHPIPAHALAQIEKAARERAEQSSEEYL